MPLDAARPGVARPPMPDPGRTPADCVRRAGPTRRGAAAKVGYPREPLRPAGPQLPRDRDTRKTR
jgi:hypothetical protein